MNIIKIYLCDFTHNTIVLVSDTMPINIGFIASYAKGIFKNKIEIKLYKFPDEAIAAIKKDPPDILGMSNYSWNSNLSEHIAKITKKINNKTITLQGGTNFPHSTKLQYEFMLKKPYTDSFIIFEGEIPFVNLIKKYIKCTGNYNNIFSGPIDGIAYIDPKSKGSRNPKIIKGLNPYRLKSLDEIPSPYLNGMMDKFFKQKLTPFLETNRGCPFKCSFCHTGNDYFNKINNYSVERIINEIRYIGPKIVKQGVVNLHLADTNFGMYSRDKEICEELLRSKNECGWPLQVMSTTGKNNKNRVIDITGILGNMFTVNMSVQSMDKNVLNNINRSNIKLNDYISINEHLQSKNRTTKAELIIGLPGETKETFIKGIEKCIQSGVAMTTIYTLMMLHGTEFKDIEYRKKYGMKGKFRIVPLNFGEYDGEKIFDYEEVCVENKDMSFDDYLYIRVFSLLVEVLLNGRPFDELFKYANFLGETKSNFLLRLLDNIETAPSKIKKIVNNFLLDTKNELWDDEEQLIKFYKKDSNYNKLKNGLLGGNLIYKYKSESIAFTVHEWIDYIENQLKNLAKETNKYSNDIIFQIEQIKNYTNYKVSGLLDHNADTSPITSYFNYDFILWMKNKSKVTELNLYSFGEPTKFTFKYDDHQLKIRNDNFSRYGVDANALSKVVTRISNLESLFRKVEIENHVYARDTVNDNDLFVRYSQSN